jgi:hypothetical protein
MYPSNATFVTEKEDAPPGSVYVGEMFVHTDPPFEENENVIVVCPTGIFVAVSVDAVTIKPGDAI